MESSRNGPRSTLLPRTEISPRRHEDAVSNETAPSEDNQSANRNQGAYEGKRCGRDLGAGVTDISGGDGCSDNMQAPLREAHERSKVGGGLTTACSTHEGWARGAETSRVKDGGRVSHAPDKKAFRCKASTRTTANSPPQQREPTGTSLTNQRSEREGETSATNNPRERVQEQSFRQRRPGHADDGIIEGRPQSGRRSTRSQSEGEETLTVRYRALGAARWKQANRNRLKTEKTPDRLQTPEHGWQQTVTASTQGGTPVSRGRPPQIPGVPRDERQLPCRTKGSEGKRNSNHPGGDNEANATVSSRQEDHNGTLIEEYATDNPVDARIPTRPRSAAAVARGIFASARPRPRSASTSSTVSHYRQKLESAYTVQMRAMERLQKRKTEASSSGRPTSGGRGREGVGTGHFQSRYSGLHRFVLLKRWDGNRDRSVSTGASRYGAGVPYFGPP